jgi:hypothetical protein
VIPQTLRQAPDADERPWSREAWLTSAAVLLRPWFSARGYEIPLRLRVGVGALGLSQRILGVLYPERDAEGFRHITISPFIDDPATVALVLVHELIHAVLPAEELHGPRFQAAALALGLRAPFTTICASDELRAHVEGLVRKLGRYPHRAPLAQGAVFSLG